jgi:hypothetical protein
MPLAIQFNKSLLVSFETSYRTAKKVFSKGGDQMRRLIRYVFCISLVVSLISCVSTKSYKAVEGPIEFQNYKKIKLAIQDDVNTPYSSEGLPMFEGLLKGKLKSLGFQVVDVDEDMALDINVTAFKPGSTAARLLIGFGAGRAVFIYTANFKEKNGKLLTTLEGGKSYHGMEFIDNPLYKNDEELRMGMIQQAVIQIGDFIKNKGVLEAQ